MADAKTAEKLRDLARTLLEGKGNRKEIAAALSESADRLDKLDRLREALEQEAWTKLFAACIQGYLSDPLVDIESNETRDAMLRNCHDVAERGLVHWRYRWAGGPSPYPKRRREHMSREELDQLPAEPLETPERVQQHVVSVVDAMSALSEKDKATRARRVREELGEIKPLPKRKRRPGEEATVETPDPSFAQEPSTLPIPENENEPPPEPPVLAPSAVSPEPVTVAEASSPSVPTHGVPEAEEKKEPAEGEEGCWDD